MARRPFVSKDESEVYILTWSASALRFSIGR